MRNFYIHLTLIGMILFASCRTTESVSTKLENAADFEIYFKSKIQNIKTFYGTGNITIESPEFSNNATCKVKIIYPDTLLLELKGIFGISVGTFLLTKNNYLFYNQIENKIIEGEFDSIHNKPYLDLNLSSREIIDFFAGIFFYNYVNFKNSQLIKDNEEFIIESTTNYSIKKIWIDPDNLQIKKIAEIDNIGKNVFEGFARSYDKKLNLPTWMRIILNSQNTSLTLSYSDIQINKSVNLNLHEITAKKLIQ